MNYYERHIGDYLKDTTHLSLLEHGVYTRLLDVYYTREGAIPQDQAARLIGARSREEKEALQAVLGEFFELVDGHWRQGRCDREIAQYVDGEPEREIKKANETNRLKRHREERARLFKAITDAGMHAPWNAPMEELRRLAATLSETPAATAPDTQPATRPATAPATPATATQTPVPDTSPRGKDLKPASRARGIPPESPPDAPPPLALVEPASRDVIPVQRVVDAYHAALPSHPRVEILTDTRRGYVQQRWRDLRTRGEFATVDDGVGWFRDFFAHVGRSAFLSGRVKPRDGKRPFVAPFDWLMRPENFAKVVEGRYHEEHAA